MNIVLLLSRFMLAGVFSLAALAKFAHRAGTRQTLCDFGVPDGLTLPLAAVLPLAELVIAAALLPARTAWWGAAAALTCLLIFLVAIAYALARGRRPACQCFGQISALPIGRATLLRNVILAGVAALIVWQGQQHPGTFPAAHGLILAAGAIALVLALLESWVLIQFVGQNGRLLARLDRLEAKLTPPRTPGLPMGMPAPKFRLNDLSGQEVTLDALRSDGKPVLLAFTDAGCAACGAILPDLARWQRALTSSVRVAVVSSGSVQQNRAHAADHDLAKILLQPDGTVAAAYQVTRTPSAVVVLPDGTIGSPLAEGPAAISDLARLLARLRHDHGLQGVAGQPPFIRTQFLGVLARQDDGAGAKAVTEGVQGDDGLS
jgi:peroxiredoxin